MLYATGRVLDDSRRFLAAEPSEEEAVSFVNHSTCAAVTS